jgi:hypothetical protein
MKKIINSVLYDSEKATKLLKIDALIGGRQLFVTMNRNFFTIENGGISDTIVPSTKQEALDFLMINRDKVEPLRFTQILNVHFGLNEKVHNPLDKALKVAEAAFPKNEVLFCTQPGRQFYLSINEKPVLINQGEALNWIEKNQSDIENLEKVLHNYFPTIKRA